MTTRGYLGTTPTLAKGVYIDPSAQLIGKVSCAEDVSVWPMAVIRGDVNMIHIGQQSNIQDGSVLHVTHAYSEHPEGFALTIGEQVTVGHNVVLHGCCIGNQCLIGMSSTILDGAVLADQVLLGAGSLVSPGKQLEGGYLWLGNPAKKVRRLNAKELAWFAYSAQHYVNLKNEYLG